MLSPYAKNIIKEIVEQITEAADELMNEEETDLHFGQRLAYAEAISILQRACTGEDLKELGLDFDPDIRYL